MGKEKEIILVRHAETAWNRENRVQGSLDIPLNYEGTKQASKIAQSLSNLTIDYIFSSRLKRSYQTALEIARPHHLQVQLDERLNELSQGKWEGMLISEIKKYYPELYAAWMKNPSLVIPPGGEGIVEVLFRVREFWKIKIVPLRGRIVIVGHKVINALIKSIAEETTDLSNLWDRLPENAQIEVIHPEKLLEDNHRFPKGDLSQRKEK